MADEPNPSPKPAPSEPNQPNNPPSPTGPTPPGQTTSGSPAGPGQDNKAPGKPGDSESIAPEALADGTVPTVLSSSSQVTHTESKKGAVALSSVYRRADILSTLLTLAGAIVAAAIILGGYWYFTQSKTDTDTAKPKVTTLDKAELEKLGAFFSGNSAGDSAQILNISSSTFFKNRVAINNDLKVVGGAQISGPTALGDLTVDKTSTLGITNIRGQLTVAGPVTFQSPAILSGGASVTGNVTASGNGSFGGSLSAAGFNVRDLSVTGTLNIAGHLAIAGQVPSVAPASEAGGGANANVDGNDAAGTVTINTGAVAAQVPDTGGLLVQINFRTPYAKVPRVIITPSTLSAAPLPYYVIKTNRYFIIGSSTSAKSNTGYSFDYWVVQ